MITAYLSSERYFLLYNTGVLTNLELTITDPSGTQTSITAELVTTAPINFLYKAGPFSFDYSGSHRMSWTADGAFLVREDLRVETAPQAYAAPGILSTFMYPGALGATPEVYILDEEGVEIEECAYTALPVTVTGTVAAPITLATPAVFAVTFNTAEAVTIGAATWQLNDLLAEINSQITGGRVIASGSYLQFRSDATDETSSITLSGAGLTALGFTAGTYTASYLDSPVDLDPLSGSVGYETHYQVKLDEGVYFLLWCAAGAVVDSAPIIVYTPASQPSITCQIADSNALPLAGVTAVVSDASGDPVGEGLSDINGMFSVSVVPGDYVISLRRLGQTFTNNNFAIEVCDPQDSAFTNQYYLYTDYTRPIFSDAAIFSSEDLTIMTARFANLQGAPLPNVSVLISNQYVPLSLTSSLGTLVGVLGPSTRVIADVYGRLSVTLLRGITIEVAVEYTSVRRTFVVPDTSTFDLLDYLSTADLFDIVRLQTNTAVRDDI